MKKTWTLSVLLALILLPSAVSATEIRWKRTKAAETIDRLLEKARSFVGVPYVSAGFTLSGVDCSGFTSAVYSEAAGLDIPRSTRGQLVLGTAVKGEWAPGDLLFFNTVGTGPSHVGLYLGSHRMIHAASEGSRTGVIISNIDENYYTSRYLFARRLLSAGNATLEVVLSEKPENVELERTLRPGTWFDLQLDTQALQDRSFKILVKHDGKDFITKVNRQNLPSALDRLYLPKNGDWTIDVLRLNGRLLARISLKVA